MEDIMENIGVMQEIEELLSQGNTSRQVIDLGYAPGTVYGVQRRVRRQSSEQENNEAHHQVTEQSADIAPLIEDIVERVVRLEERMETVTLSNDDLDDPIADHVNEINQQVNILAAKLDELLKRCDQLEVLSGEYVEDHNRIASVMSQINEDVKRGFEAQSDQAKANQARLIELESTTKHLENRLQANVSVDNQLSSNLNAVEQRIPYIEKKIKNLTLCQPTGEVVSVGLTDKRDHRFKEYKSPIGLSRPYRHSRDLFMNDRWIDLAEPLD